MGRPEKITSALLDASSLLGVVTGEETFACLKPLLAAVDREEIRLVESTAILIGLGTATWLVIQVSRPKVSGPFDPFAAAFIALLLALYIVGLITCQLWCCDNCRPLLLQPA